MDVYHKVAIVYIDSNQQTWLNVRRAVEGKGYLEAQQQFEVPEFTATEIFTLTNYGL